jgi:hypothetical protein
MRTNKPYEDRRLDLHELWKKAGRTPPGSILVLPPENGTQEGDAQIHVSK